MADVKVKEDKIIEIPPCEHEWITMNEEDWGEMDYDSAGRSVEHFIVSLVGCPKCGEMYKTYRGDFNGEIPKGATDITDQDREIVKGYMEEWLKPNSFLHKRRSSYGTVIGILVGGVIGGFVGRPMDRFYFGIVIGAVAFGLLGYFVDLAISEIKTRKK